MQSTDSLPGDQKAVLQLVLGRGRSYDEIARMLSIDPGAVRERALSALDALGPQTRVPDERRSLIADYLLGQLGEDRVPEARDLLGRSAPERAWARVVSAELEPLAANPLPEIPTSGAAAPSTPPPSPAAPAAEPVAPGAGEPAAGTGADDLTWGAGAEPPAEERPARGSASGPASRVAAAVGASETARDEEPDSESEGAGRRRGRGRRGRRAGRDATAGAAGAASASGGGDGAGGPRSSRLGGMLLIGLAVAIVAVVLIIVLSSSGSSPSHHSLGASATQTTSTAASTASAGASTSTTSASSSGSKVLAQINLTPPAGTAAKTAGIAEVLSGSTGNEIAIVAQNVPANSTKPPNAYAVWLYNSPTDAKILGFVNPGVGSTGRLSTAGPLPTNASHYKQLIVTLETTAQPKTPGKLILQGTLTGV